MQLSKCFHSFLVANGGWSQWHDWGSCSAKCGDGNQKRVRVCDNPIPEYGGTDCTDNGSTSSETRNCVGNECPGKTNRLDFSEIYLNFLHLYYIRLFPII